MHFKHGIGAPSLPHLMNLWGKSLESFSLNILGCSAHMEAYDPSPTSIKKASGLKSLSTLFIRKQPWGKTSPWRFCYQKAFYLLPCWNNTTVSSAASSPTTATMFREDFRPFFPSTFLSDQWSSQHLFNKVVATAYFSNSLDPNASFKTIPLELSHATERLCGNTVSEAAPVVLPLSIFEWIFVLS